MTQLSNSNINAVADLKPGYKLGAADVALLQEMALRLLAVEVQEPVYISEDGHQAIVSLLNNEFSRCGRYVALSRSSGEPVEKRYPVYLSPPAPVAQPVQVPDVDLPSEFYSSGGVVVQLEKVMAALAVCGVKYKRKGNACRAAMLQAQSVCTCPSGDGSLLWPCPSHPGNSPEHSGLRPEQNSGSPAQDGNSPAQSPIYHGYRPECECSGCKTTARICAELAGNSPVIPDGYVIVPKEPTERMVIAGFESEPDEGFSELQVWEAYEDMSGCEQAAHRARLCWAAMLAAAPQEVK